MKLSDIPQSETPDAPSQDARTLNLIVRFAVLGAFVFGLLPASVDAQARSQSRKNGAASSSSSSSARRANSKSDKAAKTAKSPAKVNEAPFRAFILSAKKRKEAGKLDLSRPRSITIEADREDDGTLKNVVFTGEAASDPQMRRTAEEFVSAVNESRALQALEGVSRVAMTFTLNGERFTADTSSETPSPARAEEMARGYRMMLNIARMMKRGGPEAVVLNNMKISSSGKHLVMKLETTREAMGNLLLKQVTPN